MKDAPRGDHILIGAIGRGDAAALGALKPGFSHRADKPAEFRPNCCLSDEVIELEAGDPAGRISLLAMKLWLVATGRDLQPDRRATRVAQVIELIILGQSLLRAAATASRSDGLNGYDGESEA